MGRLDDWAKYLPPEVHRLPADLAAILVFQAVTVAVVFLPVVRETPVRVLFGLPLVLFVPGYSLIAALFPESGGDEGTSASEAAGSDDVNSVSAAITARSGGIDGVERVALSFGTSIAIVPLVGLILNFTPWGIRLVPIMVCLTGVTVALTVVAAQRRWALPPEYRFRVPYRAWLVSARTELLEPADRKDAALNVLLVISVLLATASVGYAVAVPKQGEAFSELYLLTETQDGELVADDYPTNFSENQSRPIIVGVGNHEHERVDYRVVVTLQRVEVHDNSTTVLAQDRLSTLTTTLAANDTWETTYSITPTMTGTRLRLAFLLYRGPLPETPTLDNAYREVHLWIDVSE